MRRTGDAAPLSAAIDQRPPIHPLSLNGRLGAPSPAGGSSVAIAKRPVTAVVCNPTNVLAASVPPLPSTSTLSVLRIVTIAFLASGLWAQCVAPTGCRRRSVGARTSPHWRTAVTATAAHWRFGRDHIGWRVSDHHRLLVGVLKSATSALCDLHRVEELAHRCRRKASCGFQLAESVGRWSSGSTWYAYDRWLSLRSGGFRAQADADTPPTRATAPLDLQRRHVVSQSNLRAVCRCTSTGEGHPTGLSHRKECTWHKIVCAD